MFGDDAGPLLAPAFAENISHHYVCFPSQVLDHLRLDDPIPTMQEQAQAAARAAASLDKLWQEQQRAPVLAGDEYGCFLNLYQMTHAARILATHRAAIMAARRAIQQGDRAEAEEQLAVAHAHLDQAAPEWAALNRKIPRDRRLASPMRKTSTAGLLSTLDPAELRKEAEDLARRCNELIAAYTIPGWFERACRKRELVAVRAAEPIAADGRLDERTWAAAPRIEHFVDWRALRLESLETVGRLAYDDTALYVVFECFDPKPSEIATAMPGPDHHALCDSIEVLIAPRAAGKEFVHWIVDSKGTVFDARSAKAADGMTKHAPSWNGTARVKVAQGADRWTVEMAIPREDLGLRLAQGPGCRILLCRNIVHTRPKGEHEQNAVVFLDGSNFHTVEKFATLQFGGPDARTPEPQVDIELRPLTFGHETTGDGSGTHFGGGLRVETDRNLHDFRVVAECTDGVKPLGKTEVGAAALVQLRWTPKEPVVIRVPVEVPGVVSTFTISSREGTWEFVRRFGNPRRGDVPRDRLFAPGFDGQALAMPAHFSSLDPPKLNVEEGTVEFWVRPHWDVVPRSSGPRGSLEHVFLNVGPVRPDHPYLSNHSSLTISHTAHGVLSAILSNAAYEARSVDASIRHWRQGEWHHVAVQWKLDDGGKTAMALFLDGKLASDRCVGSAKSPNDHPLKMKPLPYPVQVGSMNTGFRPADARIDELRISSVRRYRGPFAPGKRLGSDPQTLALFRFDGTLEAETPTGCSAVSGPVQ